VKCGVVDRFGTPGGDCLQPLDVEIGPWRLTVSVERVKKANMGSRFLSALDTAVQAALREVARR
jgi:hypothetical protein